jgi:RNA polymerase sigma-70 factor (sigma-E family)
VKVAVHDDFEQYLREAWPRLVRSAWLLTGDWQRAEDLVQTVLVRAYPRWQRLRSDSPDGYLRQMLVTTYLSWWRRRWRGEIPASDLPDRAGGDDGTQTELRLAVHRLLAALPRRQRAVLFLRYYADMTEEATAATLGIGVGSVKTHASRALARLRADPAVLTLLSEGVHR